MPKPASSSVKEGQSRRRSSFVFALWTLGGLLGGQAADASFESVSQAGTLYTTGPVRLAQADDFGSGVQGGVTLRQPLLGQGAAPSKLDVKTVTVKGIGSSSEDAQRDAARQAVQQVAGLYIDARRQVESKITDKAVSDIVHEQILSYSNAYITKLELTNASKQANGLLLVEARVSVAVAPLVKVLQDNKVPTVAFDTATARGQIEVAEREKQSAVDIYADLIKRSADLISVSPGTPKVNTALPAPADKSWLTIPITYIANDEAVRDWRGKLEQIASAHMSLDMPIGRKVANASSSQPCSIPVFDAQDRLNHNDLEEGFFGPVPTDALGITACFSQGDGSSSVPVDCFGRIFPDGARPAQDICKGADCLSFGAHARKLSMRFELLDTGGLVIESVPIRFSAFPMIRVEGSASAPPPGASVFFDDCVPKQAPFYASIEGFTAYGGTVLVLPKPGARLHAYGNFLLPNDIIARTASLRVRIVQN